MARVKSLKFSGISTVMIGCTLGLSFLGCGGDTGINTAQGLAALCTGLPDEGDLLAWLQAGNYATYAAESSTHASSGPHFGDVRTFISPILESSLSSSAGEHPICSTAVKELYGSGATVLGWAVAIKVADASAGGDNWYWYEYYAGSELIAAQGSSSCKGCHSSGQDFILAPYPLQ